MSDHFKNLMALVERAAKDIPDIELQRRIVYGGDRAETRQGVDLIPWRLVQDRRW